MAKLIYVMNVSLDGYIADEDGKLDWTAPDEEFFSFINDLERPVGTYLYGRQLYDLMQVWETDPAAAAQSPAAGEFAEIWQAADKVVYSRTLAAASTSSPPGPGSSSNCWTSAGSPTAWCTCATAPRHEAAFPLTVERQENLSRHREANVLGWPRHPVRLAPSACAAAHSSSRQAHTTGKSAPWITPVSARRRSHSPKASRMSTGTPGSISLTLLYHGA